MWAPFRLDLCQLCAAKLRLVRDLKGEEAMASAIGSVLCLTCRSKIPGYDPALRLVVNLKRAVN